MQHIFFICIYKKISTFVYFYTINRFHDKLDYKYYVFIHITQSHKQSKKVHFSYTKIEYKIVEHDDFYLFQLKGDRYNNLLSTKSKSQLNKPVLNLCKNAS